VEKTTLIEWLSNEFISNDEGFEEKESRVMLRNCQDIGNFNVLQGDLLRLYP
jgi:hypothetical protein